jgi:hypothetical protein
MQVLFEHLSMKTHLNRTEEYVLKFISQVRSVYLNNIEAVG